MSLPGAGAWRITRRESEGLSYLLINERPLSAPRAPRVDDETTRAELQEMTRKVFGTFSFLFSWERPLRLPVIDILGREG